MVNAAVCFGTTGTAQALGPDADPLSLGAARIMIGGGALAAIALVLQLTGRRDDATGTSVAPTPGGRTSRFAPILAVLAGAAGVLAYQPAFFAGTAANGVAVGTVVALGSAPVLTGVLDWLMRRRFPGGVWVVATALACLLFVPRDLARFGTDLGYTAVFLGNWAAWRSGGYFDLDAPSSPLLHLWSIAVARTHPLVVAPHSTTESTPSETSTEARFVPKNPDAPFFRITISSSRGSSRGSISTHVPPSLRSASAGAFLTQRPPSRRFGSKPMVV